MFDKVDTHIERVKMRATQSSVPRWSMVDRSLRSGTISTKSSKCDYSTIRYNLALRRENEESGRENLRPLAKS